jgi:hypothetical protein
MQTGQANKNCYCTPKGNELKHFARIENISRDARRTRFELLVESHHSSECGGPMKYEISPVHTHKYIIANGANALVLTSVATLMFNGSEAVDRGRIIFEKEGTRLVGRAATVDLEYACNFVSFY